MVAYRNSNHFPQIARTNYNASCMFTANVLSSDTSGGNSPLRTVIRYGHKLATVSIVFGFGTVTFSVVCISFLSK